MKLLAAELLRRDAAELLLLPLLYAVLVQAAVVAGVLLLDTLLVFVAVCVEVPPWCKRYCLYSFCFVVLMHSPVTSGTKRLQILFWSVFMRKHNQISRGGKLICFGVK